MEMTIAKPKENGMKNTRGLDAFDLEAAKEGQSVKRLGVLRPVRKHTYGNKMAVSACSSRHKGNSIDNRISISSRF